MVKVFSCCNLIHGEQKGSLHHRYQYLGWAKRVTLHHFISSFKWSINILLQFFMMFAVCFHALCLNKTKLTFWFFSLS